MAFLVPFPQSFVCHQRISSKVPPQLAHSHSSGIARLEKLDTCNQLAIVGGGAFVAFLLTARRNSHRLRPHLHVFDRGQPIYARARVAKVGCFVSSLDADYLADALDLCDEESLEELFNQASGGSDAASFAKAIDLASIDDMIMDGIASDRDLLALWGDIQTELDYGSFCEWYSKVLRLSSSKEGADDNEQDDAGDVLLKYTADQLVDLKGDDLLVGDESSADQLRSDSNYDSLFRKACDQNGFLGFEMLSEVPEISAMLRDGDLTEEELDTICTETLTNGAQSKLDLVAFRTLMNRIDDLFEPSDRSWPLVEPVDIAASRREAIINTIKLGDWKLRDRGGVLRPPRILPGGILNPVSSLWEHELHGRTQLLESATQRIASQGMSRPLIYCSVFADGLHFDWELLRRLLDKGVAVSEVWVVEYRMSTSSVDDAGPSPALSAFCDWFGQEGINVYAFGSVDEMHDWALGIPEPVLADVVVQCVTRGSQHMFVQDMTTPNAVPVNLDLCGWATNPVSRHLLRSHGLVIRNLAMVDGEHWAQNFDEFAVQNPRNFNNKHRYSTDVRSTSFPFNEVVEGLRPTMSADFGLFPEDVYVHSAFFVHYGPGWNTELVRHSDDSLLTLNICLKTQDLFGCGVRFFGRRSLGRGTADTGTAAEDDDDKDTTVVEVPMGAALMHWGDHQHETLPWESGERWSLIIWLKLR